MSNVKQVIVIRRDLGMRRGKEIAQGSHASQAWLVKRVKEIDQAYEDWALGRTTKAPEVGVPMTTPEHRWIYGEFRKVVCQVQTEAELKELHQKALDKGLESHLITDMGATEFNGVPTITALAIGPDDAQDIDPITSHLKLY